MNITIVISCHKESPYLKEAIESALNQDYRDFEVVLSSDGWYGAIEVADSYGIECFVHSAKGHSHALNETVKCLQSDYIKDHHYDDIMLPNCLASLSKGFGADLIYANAINVYPGSEKFYFPDKEISWKSFWPPVKTGIHAAAHIFKRDTFLRLGGRDESIDNSEEVEYYMKLLANGGTFKYVDSFVARYRVHDDSKTARYSREQRLNITKYLVERYGHLANKQGV